MAKSVSARRTNTVKSNLFKATTSHVEFNSL